MSVDTLLQRLKKVTGRNGHWTACCPAHEDRSPSLAIRVVEDGRILLKCFGGCSVQEIVGSIGMNLSDLFPPDDKLSHHKPRVKNAFYATDLLRVIEFESVLVSVAASNLANGVKLNDNDRSRLRKAQERIIEAARHIR
jgi:hypothetical protein